MAYGTLVATLVGGGLSLVGTWLASFFEHRRWERQRREELRRACVISPVIAFVDELLQLIEATYWNATDLIDNGEKWNEENVPQALDIERFKLFREKEGKVLARIHAFADSDLATKLAYVEAVRSAAIQRLGKIQPGSELEQWLSWATQHADRIDPLVESPPSILDE